MSSLFHLPAPRFITKIHIRVGWWLFIVSLCLASGCDSGPLAEDDGANGQVSCDGGTCECQESADCEPGAACIDNRCMMDSDPNREPPDNPRCFSPCRQGFVDQAGDYHECSAEGLMEGCLDSAECENGSCVRPDAGPSPGCTGDVDCPDFQTCIRGACYSDCEGNGACDAPRECYRKVCRLPCSAAAEECPDGTYCSVTDGEHGYCLPLRESEGEDAAVRSVPGEFELSTGTLVFSNQQIEGSFTIAHTAPRQLEFTVRRAQHSHYDENGLQIVGDDEDEISLPWLAIGASGAAEKQLAFSIDVNPGEAVTIDVGIDSGDETPAKWDGVLEVSNPELGTQRVSLSYAQGADGRWSGKVYYFTQFGDKNLEAWEDDKNDAEKLQAVGNAFIQKWGALRRGRLSGGLDEFDAVVSSTITESWRWSQIQDLCRDAGHGACFPFTNDDGFGVYAESTTLHPVPSGLVELPIALDLAQGESGSELLGRIASEQSLHYSQNPAFELDFATDPNQCANDDEGLCLAFVDRIRSDIVVGGRYRASKNDVDCQRASDFELAQIPVLVPGFKQGVSTDAATGLRHRYECRDTLKPQQGDEELNASLSAANPIPDGRSRQRRLELVDGMLVNQDVLYILLRESFLESFLGAADEEGFFSYGLMVLRRSNAQLDAESYTGTKQEESREQPVDILDDKVSCPARVVEQVLGADVALDATTAGDLAAGLLNGQPPPSVVPALPLTPDQVHYLCHDSGRFDQGASPTVSPSDCPAGSGVTFFTGSALPDLTTLPCQEDGTCGLTLSDWERTGSHGIVLDPIWRCLDPNQVYCDGDRLDLRNGKEFFLPAPGAPVFVPLLPEIDNAFRYKTRFRNRQGTNLGFVPEICIQGSDAIPYCYDPEAIERIRERVDCLVHILSSYTLPVEQLDSVRGYLTSNFSYDQEIDPNQALPIIHDGFERLYAELLIMLGDESYTTAFLSRFDLAQSSLVSFEGSNFEPNGVDLSGVAGFEMYTLYQAAQYYEMVVDRFYSLSPYIWESVSADDPSRAFVTQATVTSYIDRVLRASTQRARTWSEIGKRYQSLNRPDLARLVVERAYASAYLESIVLSRMMQRIVPTVTPQERVQITQTMDRAALAYRVALLDMREVYADFTDEVNYFGFSTDYIPLPALEPNEGNAVDLLIARARQSAQVAALKEDLAISSNRSFDTDAAAFQGELTRIRNTYENQLAEICGTFEGDDGRIYPAIRKYAYQSELGRILGDPCGLVGNGALHDAMGGMELAELNIQGIENAYNRIRAEVDIELDRARQQCDNTLELARYKWKVGELSDDLQNEIAATELIVNSLVRAKETATKITELKTCTVIVGLATGGDCVSKTLATVSYTLSVEAFNAALAAKEAVVAAKASKIRDIERAAAYWETAKQCDIIRVDSDARVKQLLLGMKDVDLEALKTDYEVRLALSNISELRNQATRIMAEQEETEQLAINLEAARNDPNTRIYKNDAIINADRTFYSALRDAYRATKVYEYYTSQSYARRDALGLIRLVSRGDYNLEEYLTELEDAYEAFQEEVGRPDTRVDIVSLRDDVLDIPRYSAGGTPLSESQRVEMFRDTLISAQWLDGNGYRVFPFSTSLGRLSPVTRNHKIAFLETEIIGSNVGDPLGRIYVGQSGTGQVHAVDDSKIYYRFPERLSVLNPFFNGVRSFTPDVYRNEHLRDRPYVNTSWELVLNQRDELVNQDIDINSLTDVRVYVYYTDFTEL